MIECPNCKISFNPRHRTCPRCKGYEARLEDRLEFLARSAEVAFERGAPVAEIEAMLIEEGVSPLEASEIVSVKTTRIKRITRGYGVFRLAGGLGALLLAGILVVLAVLAAGKPSAAGKIMHFALMLALFGLGLFLSGIYSTVTGREK